jgi:hypothetical protein
MRVTQRLFNTLTLIAVAALVAIVPTNMFAMALPVNPDGGILSLGPFAGTLVGVTSGANACISWAAQPGALCVAGTTHQMSVNGSSTSFANGSTATDQIKDIVGLPFPPPTLPLFETIQGGAFVGGATVKFDLTQVVVNTGATIGNCGSNAPLNQCTPANSPFTFAEDITGTQVKISFSVFKIAYINTTADGFTNYKGEFDTTLSGNQPVNAANGTCSGVADTITSLLGCEATGGTITASWTSSESPVTNTPEPFTFVLFGSGLVGVAFFGRRFRRS